MSHIDFILNATFYNRISNYWYYCIAACANGEFKHAGGYKWEYTKGGKG